VEGQIRPRNLCKKPLAKKMDARVKPAHDSLAIEGRRRCFQALGKAVKLAPSNAQSKGHTP